MKGAATHRKSHPALCTLLVLCTGSAAWAQIGVYSRPSDFYTPSQRMGYLGGRYSYSYPGMSTLNSTPLAPDTDPLRVKVAPRDNSGGGMRADVPGAATSIFSPAYSPVAPSLGSLGSPLAPPLADRMGTPLNFSIPVSSPAYGETYMPGRNTLFRPTVEAGGLSKLPKSREVSLKSVTPGGPTVSAVGSQRQTPATQPYTELEAMEQMSQRHATRNSDEGAACLQRAMEALRSERFRGEPAKKDPKTGTIIEPYKPGAIDLFKQARLLLGDQPEPTLGLIASLVSTGDYSQASALVGQLVGKWPDVMARNDFAQVFYARPEQARVQSLALRQVALERGNSDLRLLLAFYRWHMESKQGAAGDVVQIVRQEGQQPDSAAMAMARAMGAAMGTGG
jgi:hypothetical protein